MLTSKVNKLQLSCELASVVVAARSGTYVNESDYDLLIDGGDIDVFAPNGSWLLSHRADAIDWDNYGHLVPLIAALRGDVDGRGYAVFNEVKLPFLCKDGTVSASHIHHIPQLESLGDGFSIRFGYSGRTGLNPYGHKTHHWEEQPEAFDAILPLIQALSAAYRNAMPEWFSTQQQLARQTPDWLLPGTCFNNVTINQNMQFSLHKDKGNFDAAVLTVLTSGEYSGGTLVFPQYLLGVRLKPGNVLVADTRHGWHGNTALYGAPGASYRHSYVAHFHRAMLKLGTTGEEAERRCRWRERRAHIEYHWEH